MSRKIRFFGLFLFLVLPFLFLPKKILAQVVINEVYYQGDSGNEWVELVNMGGENQNTSGWEIEDNTSSDFLPEIIIPPGGFGVIITSNSSVSGIDPNAKIIRLDDDKIGNGLSDAGDRIILKRDDGIINQMSYGNDKSILDLAGVISGHSLERVPFGTGMFIDQSSPTPGRGISEMPTPSPTPTPTQILPTLTPVPASYSNIYISEFVAWPESGNEWVELYNDNDFEVNLWGWYIDDLADGGSPPKSISGTIAPRSYKQFFISDFYFNNDGDEVRLLDGNKSEKDSTSFEKSIKGKSWSKDKNGNWCQAEPTPNSPNSDCPSPTSPPTPTPTPTSTLTPTPIKTPASSKTPTPTLSLIPTEENQLNLLGEASGNSSVLGAHVSPTKIPENKNKLKITAGIFIFSGLVLLGISGFFLLKQELGEKNDI